jgi:hypothetical protein
VETTDSPSQKRVANYMVGSDDTKDPNENPPMADEDLFVL